VSFFVGERPPPRIKELVAKVYVKKYFAMLIWLAKG
jgi:hypothetical protein